MIETIKDNLPLIIAIIIMAGIILFLINRYLAWYKNFKSQLKPVVDLIGVFKDNAPAIKEMQSTPKSLSGMDKIYGPMLAKDFPEINIDQFKDMAVNSLVNVFNSIEEHKILNGNTMSKSLMTKTENIISDHKSRNIREYYDDIKVHNTVVSNYYKSHGKASIVFQTAMAYKHFTKDEQGKLLSGDDSVPIQVRYEIMMNYIQDIDLIEDRYTSESSFGLTCSNCGAPIKSLGTKVCEYCGTGIVEVNVKSWSIDNYKLR